MKPLRGLILNLFDARLSPLYAISITMYSLKSVYSEALSVQKPKPKVWPALDDFVHVLRENKVAIVRDFIRRDIPLVVAALAMRTPAVEVLGE